VGNRPYFFIIQVDRVGGKAEFPLMFTAPIIISHSTEVLQLKIISSILIRITLKSSDVEYS